MNEMKKRVSKDFRSQRASKSIYTRKIDEIYLRAFSGGFSGIIEEDLFENEADQHVRSGAGRIQVCRSRRPV